MVWEGRSREASPLSRFQTGLWEVAPAFSLVLFAESAGAIQSSRGATAHPEVGLVDWSPAPNFRLAYTLGVGWSKSMNRAFLGRLPYFQCVAVPNSDLERRQWLCFNPQMIPYLFHYLKPNGP